MKAEMLVIKCITNLHIGTSGSAYGEIKNEVEKDAVLGTPVIPASGIKGALRDFWKVVNKENKDNKVENKDNIVSIFGSEAEETDANEKGKKGNCRFVSGQLLFRAMRVSMGNCAYCLVTTPELIKMMLETIESFQIKLSDNAEKKIEKLKTAFYGIGTELNKLSDQVTAGIVGKANDSIKEVEGYQIKEVETSKNKLYKFLLKLSEGVPVVIMKTEFFQMIDLPIVARNYLENGKSSNLWYEEFVPHQSYFYSVLLWEQEDKAILDFIDGICKQPVAFGGNNSVGYGYCKMTPIVKEKLNGE